MDRLPSSAIAQPDAVLHGHQKGNESLLYVFTPAVADGRVAKVVVRTDYKQDVRRAGRKERGTVTVRTAAYVGAADLRQQRYELIWGSLD